MVFKASAHILFLARERYLVKFFFMIINFLFIFKGFNFKLPKNYRKIPKISPELIFFKGPF